MKTFSELAECLARIPPKITLYGLLFKYNYVGCLLLLMFGIDLLFAIKRDAYIFKETGWFCRFPKQVGDGWRKAANMLAQTSHWNRVRKPAHRNSVKQKYKQILVVRKKRNKRRIYGLRFLKHSKSTSQEDNGPVTPQCSSMWNVQNQHIAERERSRTVVVLISGAFVWSRLIYERCLHLRDKSAYCSAHNNLFLTLRQIHKLKNELKNTLTVAYPASRGYIFAMWICSRVHIARRSKGIPCYISFHNPERF